MGKNKDTGKSSGNIGSSYKNKIIAIGVIAVVIAGIAFYAYKSDDTVVNTFAAIDGIPCETKEYGTFHIHSHLDIFVDTKHIDVPGGIGIEGNTCLYWLHTHASDGVIHIEAPQSKDFTLSQFLDVWKSTSNNPLPADDPIIYVNGQVVSTKLSDTKLGPHEEIVLVYGIPPPNIPSFYQFPSGL